jgi:hypothetical protein
MLRRVALHIYFQAIGEEPELFIEDEKKYINGSKFEPTRIVRAPRS